MNAINLTTGFSVATQAPLDHNTYFLTLADMQDLGVSNSNAYKYYDGMIVYCLGTDKRYKWKESASGVLTTSFTYPAGFISNGVDYGGRAFNFVELAFDGERSLYRGIHNTVNAYDINDLVEVNGRLYAANSAIVAGTAFVSGVGANQFRPIQTGIVTDGDWFGAYTASINYDSGDYVEHNLKIYKANDVIPAGTVFTEGTTGATWREVSSSYSTWRGSYLVTNDYLVGEYVVRNGVIYEANDTIPAGTVFAEGTTGATWTAIDADSNRLFRGLFTNTVDYLAGHVVYYDGVFYVADINISAGLGGFNSNEWTPLGGNVACIQGIEDPTSLPLSAPLVEFFNENSPKQLFYWNIDTKVFYSYNYTDNEWQIASPQGANTWRGEHTTTIDYFVGDYVERNNNIYKANDDVPNGTAFVEGTTGATWVLVSDPGIKSGNSTWRGVWLLTNDYLGGEFVERNGKIYKSNALITAGTAFVEGTTGMSWKEISDESHEGFIESGTRAGGDYKSSWGDYDNSGNGTKLALDDDLELVRVEGDLHIDEGREIVYINNGFLLNLVMSVLTSNQTISIPNKSGVIALISDIINTLETYSVTGTRAGADSITIIGDYDSSGNSTRIIIDDNAEKIEIHCNDELDIYTSVRVKSGNTLGIEKSTGETAVFNANLLTANRVHQVPDEDGPYYVGYKTKVNVAAISVQDLNTNPYAVISAPGAGKAILLTSAFIRLNYGTVAFDMTGTLKLRHASATTHQAQISSSFANFGSSIMNRMLLADNFGASSQIIENEDLQLYLDGTDATVGDGTIDLYLTYEIITL